MWLTLFIVGQNCYKNMKEIKRNKTVDLSTTYVNLTA